MSNQERPEGWTERMQPLSQDAVATPKGQPPEFGGPRGPRMAPPQGAGDGAPTNIPPNGQGAQGGSQGQHQMTQGEQYWYEETMKARELYQKVAPLAPYVDVITYLDSNPDAVKLVTQHMHDTINGNNPNLPDPNAGDNTGVYQNQRLAPPQGNSGSYQGAGNLNSSRSDFEDSLRQANMDYIKKNGIPEHEADKYIQFLMNPGELTPEQTFNMYRTAQGLAPVQADPNQNQTTNNNQQPPLANNQRPPSPQGSPAENMPPMSVAGMNGGTVDPRDEQADKGNKSRVALDPNVI